MSKLTIDELEMLNTLELGELLWRESFNESPDFHLIEDILTVGCPIDARDNNDWTALHWAARSGNIYMMRFLLFRGSELEAKEILGRTPLHIAAFHGNVNATIFLISRGADMNAKCKYGNTAWRWACHPDIREMLKEFEPK